MSDTDPILAGDDVATLTCPYHGETWTAHGDHDPWIGFVPDDDQRECPLCGEPGEEVE